MWIRSQVMPSGTGPQPFKMRVKITLHHARPYDQDNAYAACKPVIDALKYWGLLWDDAPAYLDLTVEQAKSKHRERHTVIEIEEL